MASSEGLKPPYETEASHASPALLTDTAGSPVVATTIPPQTTFPPHGRDGSRSTPQGMNESNEYFGRKAQDQLDDDVERTDHAETPSLQNQKLLKTTQGVGRPKIERTWHTERPKPRPRSATIQGALQRTATAEEPSGNWRNPQSSRLDSSASSSSEDDSDSEPGHHSKPRGAHKMGKRQREKTQREESYSRFSLGNDQYHSKGKVSKKDGRLSISFNETANNGYIAKAVGQTLQHHLDIPDRRGHNEREQQGRHGPDRAPDTAEGRHHTPGDAASIESSVHQTTTRPRMNIVIMVIGSRGDIQPFLQIGKVLKTYGHRVRIATHPAFKSFVEKDVGLEFFSIGGDPSELMAFMVKNPGLIPGLETIREGEIGRRRDQMAEMFDGFWRSCVNATDDEKDKANLKMLGEKAPFVADAIIANPPSFAHVHIAERLGIPLHIMFTFPYSPTQAFPHPLANIKTQKSNVDTNYMNWMSYPLVEMMTWQGLGDIVNRFRVKTLGLDPVSSLWAPGALYRMKVPYTYLWSPGLVAKPKDWGPEIDIAGYVFLDLASEYTPPKDLADFLDAGEPPIYIGFGSIVVDDPDKFTKLIFEAVEKAGVRALVSKGWGGIGAGETPKNIHLLGNTPHDWLFPRVRAVIHHGGAGTTSAGLKEGRPTMVVPFFGDQPFWGAMIASAKAGAHECIPYKNLTVEKLTQGIKQCLTEEAQKNAQAIADSIAKEGDGAENAVKSFHRSLPLAGCHSMRCSILEDRVAVWKMKTSNLRLSALAAEMLVESKKLGWSDLRLLRHYEWNDFDGPGEPISGVGGALLKTGTGMARGVGMVPSRISKHIKKREDHEKRKREKAERKEQRRKMKNAAQTTGRDDVSADATHKDNTTGKPEKSQIGRPSAPEHANTASTTASTVSADPQGNLAQEVAEDIGGGFLESGGALASLPLDLGLAIGRGLHNTPRLYGDASVRKPVRITGMHSGAKAARKELFYGIYDGWSGLVTQPMHGWQDATTKHGKITGLGAGFAKGIGGFVFKDVSAIITPPFLLAQGARKEINKRLGGPGTSAFIRRVQITQGQKDLQALHDADEKNKNRKSVDEAQKLVNQGWTTMKETWEAKEEHAKAHGGSIKGRISVMREQRKWEQNGALENVGATKRALETQRQGKSLDEMFAQRRKEMEIAEQPRASAMEHPLDYEKGQGAGRKGHYKHHTRESLSATDAERNDTNQGPPTVVNPKEEVNLMTGKEEKQSLDSDTAVESPDEIPEASKTSNSVSNKGIQRMQNATDKMGSGLSANADHAAGRPTVAG